MIAVLTAVLIGVLCGVWLGALVVLRTDKRRHEGKRCPP